MGDTAILQALKLKGRATADAVATALGVTPQDAAGSIDALVSAGAAEVAGTGFRLTASGREQLASLLEDERAAVDQPALAALYEEFCAANDDFKQVVTSWQMKSDTELNDHTDAAYDRGVLERLDGIHARLSPIVQRAAEIVPRLDAYPPRFSAAIDRVRAGETDYVARPLIDSYHTVWFEFHEELIQARGLNRADEAAAGRGA